MPKTGSKSKKSKAREKERKKRGRKGLLKVNSRGTKDEKIKGTLSKRGEKAFQMGKRGNEKKAQQVKTREITADGPCPFGGSKK